MPVRAPRLPLSAGERIIYEACREAGMTKEEFIGYSRRLEHVNARTKAVVRLRKAGLSTPTIGRMIRRNSASVINMIRRAEGVKGLYRDGSWKRRKVVSPSDIPSMTRADRIAAMGAAR